MSSHRPLITESREHLPPGRRPAKIAVLIATCLALNAEGRTIVETYDEFGPDSKLTIRFDLNADFVTDATFEGPLRGRIDLELELSDAVPLADLLGVRVRRMTLLADPVMELAAQGFSATAHDFSLHLTDPEATGASGKIAIPTLSQTLGNYSWTQAGENLVYAKGTIRAGGPASFAELLDLSTQAPVPIGPYFCQWGWSALGGATTLRLNHQLSRFPVKTVFPITADFIVTLAETKPFLAPTPPVDFTSWVTGWGLAGPDAEPNADPDNDGRSNLDEFVFHQNPTATNPLDPALTVAWDGAWALYSFTRDTSRLGVATTLETSDDLVTWKAIAVGAPGTDVYGVRGGSVLQEKSLGGGRYLAVVRDGLPTLGDRQRFARLRFSLR